MSNLSNSINLSKHEAKSLHSIKLAFSGQKSSNIPHSDASTSSKKSTSLLPQSRVEVNIVTNVQDTILKHFVEEFTCTTAAVLNILPDDEFKAHCLPHIPGTPPSNKDILHNTKHFTGVLETLNSRPQVPTIYNQNCEPWKQILQFIPSVIICVPTTLISDKSPKIKDIIAITVLAFKSAKLPAIFVEDQTWQFLIDSCHLNAPIVVNTDRYEDKMREAKRMNSVIDGVRVVEKEIQDIRKCVTAIGSQLQTIFGARQAVIYARNEDDEEQILTKYDVCGGTEKIGNDCPKKSCHAKTEFTLSQQYPAGWAATKKQCVRINDPADLENVCGTSTEPLHSFAFCLVKNMMCIFIDDQTYDMPLVVELSDKPGGFTVEDENEAKLFAKLVSDVLSATLILEYRKNTIRRSDITNEIINNITKVTYKKVKQLLDFKFRNSIYFSKRFYTITFTFDEVPREQYTGVILFIFSELGFIKRWKMRRAAVIRFILSLNQAYIDNPYHNWKHACTVTHYMFYLLTKMELQKYGFVTDLEAFSLILACLCHDLGHKGLNNHFGVAAHKDSHLASQEESLIERHNIALALQILSSEDCNIVENLSDTEYQDFMKLVQWNIIATDIGKHLIERANHFEILKKFSKGKQEHRKVFMSILMTACDLSETIKNWDNYVITVKNIFFEFFEQGDEELRLGYKPTPIMDRRIAYIPYIELKFIDELVRPVYEAVAHILPDTEETLYKIDYYKDLWLIATKVFDKNVLVKNPLDILDLLEIKESHLRGEVNPELHVEVAHIRQEQHASSHNLSHHSTLHGRHSMIDADLSELRLRATRHSLKLEYYTFFQKRHGCKAKMKKMQRTLLDFCCCLKCRQQALTDAEYVRKMHHDTVFMELRSEAYEKARIEAYYAGEFSEESQNKHRETIHHLINPTERVGVVIVEENPSKKSIL